VRVHLPEGYRAGLLAGLIVDEHRGQGVFRDRELVAPHEKALSRFGALPGSGDVVQDTVPALVPDALEIAAWTRRSPRPSNGILISASPNA
jgi:hypothetical protein